MSDILSSLIVPKTSHESFFPTQSQPSSPLTKPASPTRLPIYDVDVFLNDPTNKALLTSNTNQNQNQASSCRIEPSASSSSSPPQPVQLGVKTSSHIVALYQLCQERGLVPEFEIDGDQSGFGGTVRIGEQTVGSEQKWRSKKEAKDGLAEKGVEIVGRAEAKGKSPAGGGGTSENWVGKLLEYQNALDPTLGPAYTEYALGLSFACTVEIPSHSTTFGSPNDAFPTKKAARSNAAREAVQFLISEGLTNPNGTPKPRNKKAKVGATVRIEEQGVEVKKGTTYAQRVNDLCPLLGLPCPIYRFAAASPSAPNLLSGTACFPANPILPGQYGEIRNVFGKKNAKEECARGLWEVLREVARGRGVAVGEMEEVEM